VSEEVVEKRESVCDVQGRQASEDKNWKEEEKEEEEEEEKGRERDTRCMVWLSMTIAQEGEKEKEKEEQGGTERVSPHHYLFIYGSNELFYF